MNSDIQVPESLEIVVTAEDIARGEPCNPSRCPIALAVERLPRVRYAIVAYGEVTVMFSAQPGARHVFQTEPVRYELGGDARDFIGAVDAGEVPGPAVFAAARTVADHD